MSFKEVIKSNKYIYNLFINLAYNIHLLSVWLCIFDKHYYRSRSKLKSYKKKYNNKRCFIIGNGPSLTVEDLENLKDEYTFATNMIFKIFDETDWRPTFYTAQDYTAFNHLYNDKYAISSLMKSTIFLAIDIKKTGVSLSNDVTYFYLHRKFPYPKKPKFSSDISKIIYEGGTIVYSTIQIAAYMGFKEIYLIGVDQSYSFAIQPNGEIVNDKSIKDYFSEKYNSNKIEEPVNLVKPYLAFQSAKDFLDKCNIKIYNATRGGKLEIFNRRCIDEILKKDINNK